MDNLTHYLATTLRTLRHQREWSLSRLAEETGVSKAMLGQIERNESSPPESDGTLTFDPQQQAMVVTPLFPWDPQLCFDHFSILLAPGALSESTPHETGVIEHVVVINGLLDMCIEGQWRTLKSGEGVRFAGDMAHSYRNSSEQTVHFHSLIHYPRS